MESSIVDRPSIQWHILNIRMAICESWLLIFFPMVENNKGHTGKKMSNPFNFRVTAKDLLLLLERSIFVKDSTIKVGSVLLGTIWKICCSTISTVLI